MNRPSKELLKLADELDDKGGHPLYDQNYGPPFGERYYRANVSYHLHLMFRERGVGGSSGYFCIEFSRANVGFPVRNRVLDLMKKENGKKGSVIIIEHNSGGGYIRFNDALVFVEIGKTAKYRKGMEVVPEARLDVPSLVWLKPLNLCPVLRAYFSNSLFRPTFLPALLGVADWELNGVHILDIAVRMPNCQLASEMVERRAEIVNGVSKNEAGTLEVVRDIRHFADVENMLASISLIIKPDRYLIFPEANIEDFKLLKAFNMFLGPVDFAPDIVKRVSLCYHNLMTQKDEETQKTPKGKEIPVPKREDFFEDLKKATKPDSESDTPGRPEKEELEE